MTETTENEGKKRLGLSRPGKLVLNKTVETGQVRQSFSRGRTKAVTVEVRKKRTYLQGADGRMKQVEGAPPEAEAPSTPELVAEAPAVDQTTDEAPAAPARGVNLTEQEKAARAKALQEATVAAEEAKVREAEEAEIRAREEAEAAVRAKQEAEEQAAREAEEAARRAEEEAKAETAKAEAPEPVEEAPAEPDAVTVADVEAQGIKKKDDDSPAKPKRAAKAEAKKVDAKKGDTKKVDAKKAAGPGRRGNQQRRRRSGKLTIAEALGGDQERSRSLASMRRAREKERQKRRAQMGDAQRIVRDVVIPETITVAELANRMAIRGVDVIKSLMKMGVMATPTQEIDADTAELVATEYGHKIKRISESDVEIGLHDEVDDSGNLKPRAPVVTVMGHVDHGKTSVLDAIRATDVVAGEAGGITQHIGAYQVTIASGDKISFIDTPGHAAFTDMRARGAQVTDIVVLVVAADDGIMPQTIEAISHAKAASVPIIVAINKIDLPGADPKRVRTELLQHDLVVEELGGDILTVEISAKNRTNLEQLQEAILLQAEVLDLQSNPDRPGEGVIVESKVETGRGSVATVLVQRGTLRVGDIFVAGSEWGRVRAMVDDHGGAVAEAGPAVPVEVLGLGGAPAAGDDLVVVENEGRAREITEYRQRQERAAKAGVNGRVSLEEMFQNIEKGEAKRLPLVLKADVHGSVEAIVAALEKMATDEVGVDILHSGVGEINQSDVTLAKASDGLIIGFNVRANAQSRELARQEKLEIRYYSIIYNVIDEVKQALSGMLAPSLRENLLGYAEILEVFNITKVGKIGGCKVTEGLVRRGAHVRLLRDNVVIHEGSLSQLKRFKDDAREVKNGLECGMAFTNYHDLQPGDFIECFEIEEVAREL
ncbi:MAG: translation initiation factor IF-2 [Rhodospirillales bacterium]|jgi:translation initiation factor IF-2|nr:translation initiation factor IF-2 [Rhodospirillales bacterium]